MRIIAAARFSFLVFAVAIVVTTVYARVGLRFAGVQLPRQVWLTEETTLWTLNGWLWLLAVFSWMVVLAALMWSYLPGHRLNSMLQSGLMVIAATLLIVGIIVWMNLLPWAATHAAAGEMMDLVDMLALTLFGAGTFMMGAVTAWICVDLMRHDALARGLSLPGLAAGLILVPSPFVLPQPLTVGLGLLFWLIWCLVLGLRRSMPNAFSEWK